MSLRDRPPHGRCPVFVHFFAHIARPHDEVERVLLEAPATWLPSVVESAYETGDGVRARVGIGKRGRLTKKVVVYVGEPLRDARRTVIPIRVEAAGPTGLFPQLDADLEIAPVGPDTTQLTLNGSYRPPLGAAGALLDSTLLHRVAEAVVKNFVDRVAGILQDAASPTGLRRQLVNLHNW